MPTHKFYCVYCGKNTYCINPTVLLDIRGCNESWPPITFCSLDCFESLQEEMQEALDNAKKMAQEPDNYEAQELFK